MSATYPPFYMSENRLRTVKERDTPARVALEQLRRDADAALALPLHSVMDKTAVAPSGDKHDYLSLGPYWWPDPAKPDGLPYIRRDGEVNPESADSATDRRTMDLMSETVETLALAHFHTGDARFRDSACARLAAWFTDPATRMNPHLQYAQGIPGITLGRGIGIIDTVNLTRVVNAVTLLRTAGTLPPALESGITDWFRAYLDWLLTSEHGIDERNQHNNHGTWYDAQTARFAHFIGDDERARRIIRDSATQRLLAHIAPDGSQPHELARTQSFSYSVYNLAAFLMLAMLGTELGCDLWHFPTPDNGPLRHAIAFLLPFSDTATPWPFQQITPPNRAALYMFLPVARDMYGDDIFRASIPADHRINLVY